MKRTILAMLILAATAHANIVPWMSTIFHDDDHQSFYSLTVVQHSPAYLDRTMTFNADLTLGSLIRENDYFCGVTLCLTDAVYNLTIDASGSITNAHGDVLATYVPDFLYVSNSYVEIENWYAPNDPHYDITTSYLLSGVWTNHLTTKLRAELDEENVGVGNTSNLNLQTTTPEPFTLLTLGTAFIIAARKLRTP